MEQEAYINVEVNVTCPHCNYYINLLDHKNFPELNDDGYIVGCVFNEDCGCDDFGETVECPECKEAFRVSRIIY